jgi:hypothetical protein
VLFRSSIEFVDIENRKHIVIQIEFDINALEKHMSKVGVE